MAKRGKKINKGLIIGISAIILVIILGFLYYNYGITGNVINETETNATDSNETKMNTTGINETYFNQKISNQTSSNQTVNETGIEEDEAEDELEIIYDISNQSEISPNITNAKEYCASKGLKCKAFGLFYREDCGENGWCGFEDIDGASLGAFYCNTSLTFLDDEDLAKIAICTGKKYPESEENSIYAYAVSTLDEQNMTNANKFCNSLGLKCKAVEWFYREDCKNNGWCGFDDLKDSILRLYGCGTLNNADKGGSAMVVLCSGKKETPIAEKKCMDTDGKNYSIQGYASKNKINETDSCEGNVLSEYFCDKNNLMRVLVNCSYGCEDGMCLPYVPTCTDNDGDGFSVEGGDCGASDCNDQNISIHPDIIETCEGIEGYDGIDNNCDGKIDLDCEKHCDVDGDGYSINLKFYCVFIGKSLGECDDIRADINPSVNDSSCDGTDNNCDGVIDEGCVVTNETEEIISEPVVIESGESESSLSSISGSSSGGSSGGGGSSSEDSNYVPELIISEKPISAEEIIFKGINEEQKKENQLNWLFPILAMSLLLIILLISSKLIKEIDEGSEKS